MQKWKGLRFVKKGVAKTDTEMENGEAKQLVKQKKETMEEVVG